MAQTRMTQEQFRKLTGMDTAPGKPTTRRKSSLARGEKSARFAAKFAATPPAPAMTQAEREQQRSLFERHDAATYTLRLPLAPSKNTLRSIRDLPGKRPFIVPSTEYNVYKKAVADFWRRHFNGWPPEPITGPVRICIVVHLPTPAGDIANRDEALLDALTECRCWVDDKQVKDKRIIEGAVIPDTGACDVIIETIPE